MTIICYKAGVMAADTGVWNGDVFIGHTIKIAHKNGYLFGAAGLAAGCEDLRKRFQKAKNPEELDLDPEECTALLVSPKGEVIELFDGRISTMEEGSYDAIGAGAEIAHGALASGASAEEAVAVAIERHALCAGDVTSISQNDGVIIRRSAQSVLEAMRTKRA